MECTRLKHWHFCCNRRKIFSRLDLDGGYTGNRYPFWVRLSGKLLKIELHIGYMEILLYPRIQVITPNDRMNQTNKISCGATNHS